MNALNDAMSKAEKFFEEAETVLIERKNKSMEILDRGDGMSRTTGALEELKRFRIQNMTIDPVKRANDAANRVVNGEQRRE